MGVKEFVQIDWANYILKLKGDQKMQRFRLLSVLSAVAILSMSLMGCGSATTPTPEVIATSSSQTDESDEPVVIKVLTMQQAGYTPDEMDEIAKRFSEQNPNVTVEVTYLGYDEIYDKLVTSVGVGGRPPYDVILVDQPWVSQFVGAGWLKDITAYVPDEYRSGIFDAGWNVTTIDGKIYGVPWMIDTKVFYYNTKLLEAAGYSEPPTTWEEMEDMALTMKEKGLVEYPIIWSWAQAEAAVCDFVVLLYGNGGEFMDANGKPAFNSERGVEVLSWMVNSIEKGITNPSSIASVEDDVLNVFVQGEAAFALNWPYMYEIAQFNEDMSQITGQADLALNPVFKQGRDAGIESATVDGSMAFAITDASPYADEAWAYLEFLTSKPIQMEFSAHLPPVWSSAYQSPDLETLIEQSPANDVLMPAFSAQFQFAHTRPKVPYYTEASTALQLAIQEALGGLKSPQEALDAAANTMLELQ